MMNTLVNFWNKPLISKPPYFHPADEATLFRKDKAYHAPDVISSYDDYMKDAHFARQNSAQLELSLLPIPYGGDLNKADIIILLLNPGLSYTDYYGELERPDYQKALMKNLQQDFLNTDFPFLWLNPEFCWHEGFIWWEQKLRRVLEVIAAKQYCGSYIKAMQSLSNRLGMIELVPYHSASSPPDGLLKKLPSTQEAKGYVKDVLLPQARAGEKLLIVTRQKKGWGVNEQNEDIIVYNAHEARGASLSPQSKGGAALLRRLCP